MSKQQSGEEVPRRPQLAAWIDERFEVHLLLGDVQTTRPSCTSLEQAREVVRGELGVFVGEHLRRPARAWLSDPDGAWPVIVGVDGAVRPDDDPDPQPPSPLLEVVTAEPERAAQEIQWPAPPAGARRRGARGNARRLGLAAVAAALVAAGVGAGAVLSGGRAESTVPDRAFVSTQAATAVKPAAVPDRKKTKPKPKPTVEHHRGSRAVHPVAPRRPVTTRARAAAVAPAAAPAAEARASVPRTAGRPSVACQEFGPC